MAKKPTYEELEKKIGELEKEVVKLKQVEESLQKSEQNLEVTLNSIGDAMIATDANGRVVRMNPVAEELTGWKIEEAKGRLLSEVFNIINGKTRKLAENPVDKVLREGEIVGLANHTLLIAKNGAEYQIADSGSPIKVKDGSIRGVVLVFRDVTPEYHIQQELHESEKRFRELVDLLPQAVFETDKKGNLSFFNQAASAAFGYTKEDFNKGVHALQTVIPEDREKLSMNSIRLRSGRIAKSLDYTADRKDGTTFPCIIYTSPIIREKEVVGLRGVYFDITELRQAQETLRGSERRYRELADLLPQAVFETDEKGKLSFFNQAASAAFGYTKEDFNKGIHSLQVIIPEDRKKLAAHSNNLRGGRGLKGVEYTALRKDGATFSCIVYSSSIIREKEVVGLRGVIVDITELKEAEELLRKSEELYRSVFENTGAATVILEDDMTIAMANSEFERLTGYSGRETEGRMTPAPFIVKEDRVKLVEYHTSRRNKESKSVDEYEFRLVDRKENIRNVLARGTLISGTKRSVVSLMDITSLKRAEKALRASEATFKAMLNATPDAAILLDLDGTVVECNDGLPNLFGINREGLIGKNIHKTIPETDVAERRKAKTEEVIRTGKPLQYEDERGERKVRHSVYPVFDDKGDVARIVSFSHDFTRQWREMREKDALKEKLARSKKMEAIGLMAGGVAHDLNNILTGIVSYPELLLMELPEESKLRKPIETIHRSGLRAAAVVADLLTVARGVATGQEVVDLNVVVEEHLLSAEYKELKSRHPAVSVRTRLDPGLLNIRGSMVHLGKSLMNLVLNGMEAVEDTGHIVISTMNRYLDKPLEGYDDVCIGEYAVLAVSDDGSGISSDDLPRIFEPFYTKKVMGRSGTGLGLAVVWNTVQDTNGYIDIKSNGSDTTFELYFPITRDEAVLEKQQLPLENYMGKGEQILVVDDEEVQRNIACEFLARLGYSVIAVPSGEQAVEYLKEHTADLIVLDMIMDPGINGSETYERIIKIHPKQKAVIASGFSESEEVKKAQELGAGQYIKKPYLLEKIGVTVRDELKKGS